MLQLFSKCVDPEGFVLYCRSVVLVEPFPPRVVAVLFAFLGTNYENSFSYRSALQTERKAVQSRE